MPAEASPRKKMVCRHCQTVLGPRRSLLPSVRRGGGGRDSCCWASRPRPYPSGRPRPPLEPGLCPPWPENVWVVLLLFWCWDRWPCRCCGRAGSSPGLEIVLTVLVVAYTAAILSRTCGATCSSV